MPLLRKRSGAEHPRAIRDVAAVEVNDVDDDWLIGHHLRVTSAQGRNGTGTQTPQSRVEVGRNRPRSTGGNNHTITIHRPAPHANPTTESSLTADLIGRTSQLQFSAPNTAAVTDCGEHLAIDSTALAVHSQLPFGLCLAQAIENTSTIRNLTQ